MTAKSILKKEKPRTIIQHPIRLILAAAVIGISIVMIMAVGAVIAQADLNQANALPVKPICQHKEWRLILPECNPGHALDQRVNQAF